MESLERVVRVAEGRRSITIGISAVPIVPPDASSTMLPVFMMVAAESAAPLVISPAVFSVSKPAVVILLMLRLDSDPMKTFPPAVTSRFPLVVRSTSCRCAISIPVSGVKDCCGSKATCVTVAAPVMVVAHAPLADRVSVLEVTFLICQ